MTAAGSREAPGTGSEDGFRQLTTLIGWREFVTERPSVPDLLPENEWKAEAIAAAARAELDIHSDQDQDDRAQAAHRARQQLDDTAQLFGTRLTAIPGTGTARQ